jgi:hypothetical protein
MGEFFKPWRRKIGVITLVSALALVGGWVRSTILWEELVFPIGTQSAIALSSMDRHVCFILVDSTDPSLIPGFFLWKQFPFATIDSAIFDRDFFIQQWRYGSFGMVKNRDAMGTVRIWIFPVWSLTIPLTVISFWLLLSKRRSSNQVKSPKPIPREGA